MSLSTEQRLARLHNRRTAYELIIRLREDLDTLNGIIPAGTTYLVQYCQGQARNNLLKAACKRELALQKLTGTDTLTFATRAADGATMGEWAIIWSGRTEREAICQGEYPFAE